MVLHILPWWYSVVREYLLFCALFFEQRSDLEERVVLELTAVQIEEEENCKP